MAKTLLVDVTQQDIDDGKPQYSTMCAFALALTRATGAEAVSVGHDKASYWMEKSTAGHYNRRTAVDLTMSRRASEFVYRFDHNRDSCKPARFRLPYIYIGD